MRIFPSLTDYRRQAEVCAIVPVYVRLPADLETPITVYRKLAGDDRGFILESAESGRNFGRYSLIGCQPFAELRGRRDATEICREGAKTVLSGEPLPLLREFLASLTVPAGPGDLLFMGGGVGYFAYDLAATFERIRGHVPPAELDLVRLLFCRVTAVFDHLEHTLTLIWLAAGGNGEDAGAAYAEAVEGLRALAGRIGEGRPAAAMPPAAAAAPGGGPDAADGAAAFAALVRKAKQHIAAGDVFQVVLSRRFDLPLSREPFAVYRMLRRSSPSPYMFYIDFGDKQLVGASPETLVRLEAGKLSTCPIAGTRPRGADGAADARLAAELLQDEKERAEHAMLVDLGRNDLGRVSVPGTVKVERYMEVELFSHVMHLVSLVTGRLAAGYSALDALAACFPAGTVSGAPKVRAMELIRALEGDDRGVYAGAVGYLDFGGNMDTCIAIRTMVAENGTATVRCGAGIVHDSSPEAEYQEVLHKGKALFRLVGGEVHDAAHS